MNLVAIDWISVIAVLFVLPPNELTGYIFAGSFAALVVFYLLRVLARFRGPVPQVTSRQALLGIESKYDR